MDGPWSFLSTMQYSTFPHSHIEEGAIFVFYVHGIMVYNGSAFLVSDFVESGQIDPDLARFCIRFFLKTLTS